MNLQQLLNKWDVKCDINTILSMWNESHRYYHNLNHLNDLISQINESKSKFSEKEYEKLLIAAIFHDIIYDPMDKNNEEKSADFFMNCALKKDDADIIDIRKMILDTKTHVSNTKLSESFNKFDMNIVERDFESLLEWESGIYAEYASYGKKDYQSGRLKFLESLLDKYVDNTDNLLKLIDWVKNNY
jgi:predicted metal-dependent HD superfamily phosphohydrolase